MLVYTGEPTSTTHTTFESWKAMQDSTMDGNVVYIEMFDPVTGVCTAQVYRDNSLEEHHIAVLVLKEGGTPYSGVIRRREKTRPGPEYAYVAVPTTAILLREAKQRLMQGHEMCSYDDPRARRIGFLDYTTQEEVTIPLTLLKSSPLTDADVLEYGMTGAEAWNLILTYESRRMLFGGDPLDEPAYPLDEAIFEVPDVAHMNRYFEPAHMSGIRSLRAAANTPQTLVPESGPSQEGQESRWNSMFEFPASLVAGWTHFRLDRSRDVIPVRQEPGGKMFPEWSEDQEPIYGLFRRLEGGRLLRVWLQGCAAGWDESHLRDDVCEYILYTAATFDGPAHENIERMLRLVQDLEQNPEPILG